MGTGPDTHGGGTSQTRGLERNLPLALSREAQRAGCSDGLGSGLTRETRQVHTNAPDHDDVKRREANVEIQPRTSALAPAIVQATNHMETNMATTNFQPTVTESGK